VRRDDDGTVHCVCPDGQPIALRVWVNCDLPIAPDHFKFMHIAFGMDDIDEVMLGAWDFYFGSLLWSNNAPPIFRGDTIPWDMTFDANRASFEPYRRTSPGSALRSCRSSYHARIHHRRYVRS
jgi:hypothetical protein